MKPNLWILMMVGAMAAWAGPATTPSDLNAGVACVVLAGDGDTALALAQRGGWIVLALEADAGNAAKLKEKAVAAGVLGRSLYVEQGTADKIPFADNMVDLVIVEGRAPSRPSMPAATIPPGRDGPPAAEILRVLSPGRGRALLGDQVLTKPALPGADDWTHRLHGGDNNPVSGDTAFRMPARLQYLALPQQTSFQGTALVANGRRIELTDWVTKKPDRNPIAGKLLARSLYNGQILWTRELPKNIEPDQPIVALDGDRIYLAADDSCRLLVLDAETGKDLPALALDDGQWRVKWLGIETGRLYALVGEPLPTRTPLSFIGHNREVRQNQAVAGHTIVAWDLASHRELWRHDEPVTIDYRTIAVRAGRTYFYSENTRLACLDATGKLVWENKEVAALTRPARIVNVNIESTPTLVVGPAGQLRLGLPGAAEGMLISSADGKLLWKDRQRGPKSFFVDNHYYTPQAIFDAATGKEFPETKPNHIGGGCGIVTWVQSLNAAVGHVAFGLKSPCGVGAFVAGGVMVHTASQCDCWPFQRGAAGLVAAGELKPAHPLETGHAPAPQLAATAGDWPMYRGDARRTGSALVSAGNTAQVRWVAKPEPLLPVPAGYDQQRLEWLDRPTPPVTAGGLAIYGVSDGAVRAVRIADGKPAWTFWTGGAVLTSPAVAGGRVYAGSADGWLYCLDAATGQLAWRWRGAPADARIMIYGKLMSSWPVAAVLVDQGVVYGVAGQWMQNGSVTFALDAATGRERWRQWTAPYWEGRAYLQGENPGFSPAGQLALVGGNLWVRTYLGIPAVFDTASGRRVPPTDELIRLQAKQEWTFGIRLATAGQDILVVNDQLVLQGGLPLLRNPDSRNDKAAARFIAYYVNAQGQIPGQPLSRPAIPGSGIAPALADNELLFVGGVGRGWRPETPTVGLSLWAVDVWRKEFESAQSAATDNDAADPSAPAAKKGPARPLSPAEQEMNAGFAFALDRQKARWQVENVEINAVALAKDAVLAVVGELKSTGRRKYGEAPEFTAWKLVAYDRATGKEKWSATLPGEPVFNGLAPSATGGWLVTLRDGSVVGVK